MENKDVIRIVAELEDLPDRKLERIVATELWGELTNPSHYCWKHSPWWVLDKIIRRVHAIGLFPEFFGCLTHCMSEHNFNKICGITEDRVADVSKNDLPFLMGMGLMVQPPRKIVIAAIAAKRLHDNTPEACVGTTSSRDGTRLHPHPTEQKPSTTAAVDIQKDGLEVEVMEPCLAVDCLGCFPGPDECPREQD